MTEYQPPYTITPEIYNRVATINEAIGRLTVTTSTPQVSPQVTPQVGKLLAAIQGEMSRETLQAALGLADRKSFRERYLKPALDNGLIEMTFSDKPNSRLQQYRLTEKGQVYLANIRSPHHAANNLKPKE
jgi:hypothetical protein